MKALIRLLAILTKVLLIAPLIGVILLLMTLIVYPIWPYHFAKFLSKAALSCSSYLSYKDLTHINSLWALETLKRLNTNENTFKKK